MIAARRHSRWGQPYDNASGVTVPWSDDDVEITLDDEAISGLLPHPCPRFRAMMKACRIGFLDGLRQTYYTLITSLPALPRSFEVDRVPITCLDWSTG